MRKHLFIICFAGACLTGTAQNNYADTSTRAIVANAGTTYNNLTESQSRLYNGIVHESYPYQIKGHAYYISPELAVGSITYDELAYANVPLLYDLYKDQVIVRHYNGFSVIGLVSEKVDSFSLHNHHFIRLKADSIHGSVIATGFYDQVYKGNVSMLVKRWKIINEITKDQVEKEFASRNNYYIVKGSTYYPIKKYKDLSAIFKDKAKEIKQHLKKSGIKFRKERENAILEATVYYDSLTR